MPRLRPVSNVCAVDGLPARRALHDDDNNYDSERLFGVVYTMMTIRESLTHAYLRYVASTSRPVALGPFRSELGFEVLYWLPFLEKVVSTYKIAPERCLAISRGGMGQLYPATRNVDLYQAKGIDAVRLENHCLLYTSPSPRDA